MHITYSYVTGRSTWVFAASSRNELESVESVTYMRALARVPAPSHIYRYRYRYRRYICEKARMQKLRWHICLQKYTWWHYECGQCQLQWFEWSVFKVTILYFYHSFGLVAVGASCASASRLSDIDLMASTKLKWTHTTNTLRGSLSSCRKQTKKKLCPDNENHHKFEYNAIRNYTNTHILWWWLSIFCNKTNSHDMFKYDSANWTTTVTYSDIVSIL